MIVIPSHTKYTSELLSHYISQALITIKLTESISHIKILFDKITYVFG